MQERGRLVRGDLAMAVDEIAERFGLRAEGRDGTGLKSKVPWVRAYDDVHSPDARHGWYVVYLFAEDGRSVSLSLNQGTTEYKDGEFVRRPDGVLRDRVAWARDILRSSGLVAQDLLRPISLGRGRLAEGYEIGHVCGYVYEGPLPSDDELANDLQHALQLLLNLYAQTALAPAPGDRPLEVRALEADAAEAAGRTRSGGFARRMSAPERKEIESHSMAIVESYLRSEGWTVKDTSKNKPYDFHCARGPNTLYVEVKGTTSNGSEVILTPNEVAHHREHWPDTCLAIVHDIHLFDVEGAPSCTGGRLRLIQPWRPSDENLSPISYTYRVTGT